MDKLYSEDEKTIFISDKEKFFKEILGLTVSLFEGYMFNDAMGLDTDPEHGKNMDLSKICLRICSMLLAMSDSVKVNPDVPPMVINFKKELLLDKKDHVFYNLFKDAKMKSKEKSFVIGFKLREIMKKINF